MAAFQVLIELDLHIIELDLHAVEQRIVVGCARRDLIQRMDHFDDTVQNPFWQHQTQIARRSRKRRHDHALFQSFLSTSAPALQIPEALHDDTAAQHIGKSGDALAVAVAVLERLREMLGYQQRKVGALGLLCRVLVAVSVYGYDTVGILIYDNASRVHAEGTHVVLELLGPIYDLALVELIGQMGKNHRRELHAHAEIDAVGHRLDVHFLTDFLHPLAAAAADGNDALRAVIFLVLGKNPVTVRIAGDGLYRRIEIKVDLRFEFAI